MAKITKVQQIRNHLSAGEDMKALKIASRFFTGLTKEEKRTLEIGASLDQPRARATYERLEIDVLSTYKQAILIIKNKYNG